MRARVRRAGMLGGVRGVEPGEQVEVLPLMLGG
jgi:hypothetical protein